MIGPFIFFDQMGPVTFKAGTGLDVRPHPHIGLATITYLFEGELQHRDSLGHVQRIQPGEVNWMTAGRGIVHSERTPEDLRMAPSPVFGIQAWVALPRAKEEAEPSFVHHGAASLPIIEGRGSRVRLMIGSLLGAHSPVATLSEMVYADATLAAGARLVFPAEHEERAIYVVKGVVDLSSRSFGASQLLVLSAASTRRWWRPRARACCSWAALRSMGSGTSGGTSSRALRSASSRPRPTGNPGAFPRSHTRPSPSRCRSDRR